MNSPKNKKTIDLYDNDCLFWQNDGKEYMLLIHQDDCPDNPIEDLTGESDLVKQVLWGGYSLGHTALRKGADDPNTFWQYALNKYLTEQEFQTLIKDGRLPDVKIEPVPDSNLVNVCAATRTTSVFCEATEDNEVLLEGVNLNHISLLDELSDMLSINACTELLKDMLFVLPVWVYEHSGMTVSCGKREYPYNDRFDSGLLGYAYCLKSDIEESWPEETKKDPDAWKTLAETAITADIKTLDQYLNNDIYWYELKSRPIGDTKSVTTKDDWEDIDSCGGFYGTDILESGLCEAVAYGLKEAIDTNAYRTGKAKSQQITVYTYVED